MVEYVNKYLTYQKVKIEHRHPTSEFQLIKLPKWKWDEITVNFVVCLFRILEGYDAIWIIIDWLTESTLFIPIKVTCLAEYLTEIYIANVFFLYGVLIAIISNKDARFTSHF